EGWYTSGDKNRAPGDTSFANGAGAAVIDRNGKKTCDSASHAGYVGCFTGDGAGANGQNNSGLVRNSDRLPSPDDQGTWYTRPLIPENFYGERDDAPGVPRGRHRSPAAPAGMAAPVAGGRGGGGGHGTDGGTGGRRGGPAGAPAASLAGKSSTGRSRNTSRIVATQMGRA